MLAIISNLESVPRMYSPAKFNQIGPQENNIKNSKGNASPEAHNMVPRSVPLVDHVVENSNISCFNQRFIRTYKALLNKRITLKVLDPTVSKDHASRLNLHE